MINDGTFNFSCDESADTSRSMQYTIYYTRMTNIALVAFKWNDLPDTCNERFLETCLFQNGYAGFYDDPEFGFLNSRVTVSGGINLYENYTKYNLYSTGGYNRSNIEADDMVFIKNNNLMIPTFFYIRDFARRMSLIEMNIESNIEMQKFPLIIEANQNKKNSFQAMIDKFKGFKPFVYTTDQLKVRDNVNVFNTNMPYVADKLREEKVQLWNEFFTFLGINSVAFEKNERLLVDEVNANNQQLYLNNSVLLRTRQRACDKINKKYGLNVSVEINMDEIVATREEIVNGEIYNGTPNNSPE